MLQIPYGKTTLAFQEAGASVLTSNIGEMKAGGDGFSIVKAAMAAPVNSPRLAVLAKGKRTCAIIVSDHTRPVPSRDILPNMFAELREGNPDIRITLLVAVGSHRRTTRAELEKKLGGEILSACEVVIHDCRDPETNVQVGVLPSGAPCVIDRTAAEADLLISEGFIDPHFFAGFSGGRKSILPGISSKATIYGNHCSKFIDSAFSRTGILDGNPISEEMTAAAKLSGLAYIVNVIVDEEKKTVAAFAGHPVDAHRKGCDFLMSYCRVKPVSADIVVTSNGGAPLDQNIYQCVKGMTAAEASCKPGGVIILCAECADGHGGESFYQSIRDCETPRALYDEIMATPREETIPDQWQSQVFARILINYRVIFVSRPALKEVIEAMKMTYAPSLGEAMALARNWGKESVTVIPNGVSVIVKE